MSKPYDIFLSHSGAQKEFVKELYTELSRQHGQYSVFYDEDSIKHGESISSIIVEYAKTCKLAVAVLSEEYFTRSRAPMQELAASYKASKNGNGVPCLLPIFFELRPEHVKNSVYQKNWTRTWGNWKRNEIMSRRVPYASRTNKVEPEIWEEALYKLLEIRGPVYEPDENGHESAVFAKNVASAIVGKLDELSETTVSYKATDLSGSVGVEHLSEENQWEEIDGMGVYPDSPECYDQMNVHRGSPQFFDQRERASSSGETHIEFDSTGLEVSERQENVAERERNVEVREKTVGELEKNVGEREKNVDEREKNVGEREKNVGEREKNVGEREKNVGKREKNVGKREKC